jgi:hypothetical protein
MKKTITDKHIEAINFLKAVLLQNDEKDELQIEIEKWLLKNGHIRKPAVDRTMTSKKSFRELCDFNHVYGKGKDKTNTIFFGWKQNEEGIGFKYAVAMHIENGTKAELFEAMYQWVCNSVALPFYVRYKCAVNDVNRFKVPLALNF